jgi:hypothetical protein
MVETLIPKEESKKKFVFSLTAQTGTKILLLAPSESEVDEWNDAITGANRSQNSEQEYSSSKFFIFIISFITNIRKS